MKKKEKKLYVAVKAPVLSESKICVRICFPDIIVRVKGLREEEGRMNEAFRIALRRPLLHDQYDRAVKNVRREEETRAREFRRSNLPAGVDANFDSIDNAAVMIYGECHCKRLLRGTGW